MKGPIVLKFGGSVLADESSLQLAVHEIYRWRREGHTVLAVVSALAGTTDQLVAQGKQVHPSLAADKTATLLATGESQCAGLLGLYLDRAGIPARILSAGAIDLRAQGDPLEAVPTAVDRERIEAALDSEGVAVVPGFAAQDGVGRTVVLGRGGSDLTALFLADALGGCACRLIKDVQGIYEWDPSSAGTPPRRFDVATWDDALDAGGTIVQRQAVEFARSRQLSFELGALNSSSPTRVGPGPSALVEAPAPSPPLKIALLGLGTVGKGVFDHLRGLSDQFLVTEVVVRDQKRAAQSGVPPEQLSGDPLAVAASGADIVVEALGDPDLSGAAIHTALKHGSHVVTANKAVMAEQGAHLKAEAAAHRVRLLNGACVGGSMPLLEQLGGRNSKPIRRLRGVLNGTANYVLSRVRRGATLPDALATAQELGYAEADPTLDLSGQDAAQKLSLIASALGQPELSWEPCGVEAITPAARHRAQTSESALRQVATLEILHTGARASIRLEALPATDALFAVDDEHNAVAIDYTDGSSTTLQGKGAGRWPTAQSVVGDLLRLARERVGDAARTPGGEQEVQAQTQGSQRSLDPPPSSSPLGPASQTR